MLQKLSRAHLAVARFCLNLAIAFVLLNLVLFPVNALLEVNPVLALYGDELVYAAYPDREPAEVDALLAETWGRQPVYEPSTQFLEAPHVGDYVNVDPAGFRLSNGPAPWPPDPAAINVFVFGGSTLFGYGVADSETIPAQLELLLQPELAGRHVRCYNFGQGGYFSSQERELFSELLLSGDTPQLAIFVDGLNDFVFETPLFTRRMRHLFEDSPWRSLARSGRHLPAVELALDWLEWRSLEVAHGKPPLDPRFDDPVVLDARIERYLGNVHQIEALARDAGVEPLFVVQPVPTYHYDLAHHPFASWAFGANSLPGYGYPRLARAVAKEELHLLWMADLQEDHREPLYVDQVHYSTKMNGLIAETLAAEIRARGLLETAQ